MKRVDRWLFGLGAAERLAALRIGLCAILAAQLTRTVYAELAGQPPALFRPRSFMNAFDAMPSRGVVLAVQTLGLFAAVLGMIGWRARVTVPLAWMCGVFLGGMTTSLGKVVHNDIVLLLAMAPLVIAPSGDVWSVRPAASRSSPHRRYGWPVRVAMIVVCGSYFFSGLAKLRTSGLAWAFGSNMRWVFYAASDARDSPNGVSLFIADRPALAVAAGTAILAFELAFIAAIWMRRTRPWFALAAIAFHAGTWVTIGLNYWAQAATVAVVLIDWPSVVERARTRRSSTGARDVVLEA